MLDQILKQDSRRSVLDRIRKLDKGIRVATKMGDDVAAQIMRTERDKIKRQVEGRIPLNYLEF